MPKIVIIAVLHALILGVGGFFLNLLVFGIGFSDSFIVREGYLWIIYLWKILNAPSSFLVNYDETNILIWLPVQMLTSFIWANIYALAWSVLTRHNKSLQATPKSDAPEL